MLSFVLSELEKPDDRAFMTNLYNDFYLLMFSTAKQYFHNQADREDVVQSSMEQLIRHVKLLRTLTRSALASYIVITVRNTCYNLLYANQRRAKHAVRLEDNPEVEMLADDSSIETLLAAAHDQFILSSIWGALSEEERILLAGKYFLDLPDSESAQTLGCKPDSVRMKLTRARTGGCAVPYRTDSDRRIKPIIVVMATLPKRRYLPDHFLSLNLY